MPFKDIDDTAHPTEMLPTVPAARPRVRRTPPPVVSPPGLHTTGHRVVGEEPVPVEELRQRVTDHLHLYGYDTPHGRRADTVAGRPPSVREVADRRERHRIHMERIEAAKAYVGLACTVTTFVILLIAAYFAFKIGAGDYVWGPIPRK